MVDTLRLYEDLAESLEPAAARKIAAVLGGVFEELSQAVTKADLHEVREVVHDLAAAQQRTEARLEQLASRVDDLAAAQQRTEARLEQLASRVDDLTAAQQRTEARLEQLAEAQQRTEARVEQLAEAQRRTEVEIRTLARGLKETRRMVAGLSDTVGYTLEDRAMERLPALLHAEHGIAVDEPLVRRFVEYPDGGLDEVNLYGHARRNSTALTIVGEAKARPGKTDVDRFLKLVARLERHGWIEGERFLLVIGYSIRPEVARYAQSRGVEIVPSHLLRG